MCNSKEPQNATNQWGAQSEKYASTLKRTRNRESGNLRFGEKALYEVRDNVSFYNPFLFGTPSSVQLEWTLKRKKSMVETVRKRCGNIEAGEETREWEFVFRGKSIIQSTPYQSDPRSRNPHIKVIPQNRRRLMEGTKLKNGNGAPFGNWKKETP